MVGQSSSYQSSCSSSLTVMTTEGMKLKPTQLTLSQKEGQSLIVQDNWGAGMRSVTDATGIGSMANFSLGRQCACLLEEWKRWVISAALPNNHRQDPDNAL
ncbi:hypothetical protein PHJA_000491200 [Phtheirospermum japonicum]|uniref:Uncharacterized protein n=1 Tax=Phtheirospermum japonicum TaxID=374723 RepID=A0A830BEC9_9LAMI|nr:hypothetical protein PHJA_000491200 [Phtheirospermum japonicum]